MSSWTRAFYFYEMKSQERDCWIKEYLYFFLTAFNRTKQEDKIVVMWRREDLQGALVVLVMI